MLISLHVSVSSSHCAPMLATPTSIRSALPLHLPAATDLKVAIDAISAYTHGTALRNNNNKALNAI